MCIRDSYILYVAIADVARFVKQGSVIDQEAAERGTSVYFTQRVVPMLPEIISNDLCSLRPNEDRFCLVCKTIVDKNGTLKNSTFFEALINSKARLTYERLSDEIEENKLTENVKKLSPIFLKHLKHPEIIETRGIGFFLCVEFKNQAFNFGVIKKCVQKGIITDWFLFNDKCLRISPPLNLDVKTAIDCCNKILEAIEEQSAS